MLPSSQHTRAQVPLVFLYFPSCESPSAPRSTPHPKGKAAGEWDGMSSWATALSLLSSSQKDFQAHDERKEGATILFPL